MPPRPDPTSASTAAQRSYLRDKLRTVLAALDAGFVEREQATRSVVLAVLAGQHALLLGPPGTGKSLLARAVCEAFASAADEDTGARYFEYLLTRFTHPDELFGPISIPGLKEEDYRRLTEGYLPAAEIAFVDEVFKASSAILNSLLGILNERVFHCGRHRDAVPLIGLIGASNEAPDPEGGLGALWDRFLVRLHVTPIAAPEAFLRVALGELGTMAVPPSARFTREELAAIRRAAAGVVVPEPLRAALITLRAGLLEAGVDASDRRFRQAVELARVAAWTAGRDALGPTDLMLLGTCFGDPIGDDGAVRAALGRALDAFLAPVLSVDAERDLAGAWRAVAPSGAGEAEGSARDAYAQRFARLERFEAVLAEADTALARERAQVLAEIESSPWLVEPPTRLLASFVHATRALDAYRAAARRHRDELSGLDLHGALLQRLKLAQAGPRDGLAPLHAPEVEVALWLVPPGEAPEHWIPLSTTGWLLFDAAPRLAGRVQRKLLDRALAEGLALEEARAWHATVTTLELDEAAVFALGSDWPTLARFAAERGIAQGSPALAALRALSEHLRAGGMPRLPPLPPVDLPGPR